MALVVREEGSGVIEKDLVRRSYGLFLSRMHLTRSILEWKFCSMLAREIGTAKEEFGRKLELTRALEGS